MTIDWVSWSVKTSSICSICVPFDATIDHNSDARSTSYHAIYLNVREACWTDRLFYLIFVPHLLSGYFHSHATDTLTYRQAFYHIPPLGCIGGVYRATSPGQTFGPFIFQLVCQCNTKNGGCWLCRWPGTNEKFGNGIKRANWTCLIHSQQK